ARRVAARVADDRLGQEERRLQVGRFGARRRGRRSRRGARLADVAQVVDAGKDMLADAAADQALAQLQLVGDDLEARLALGAGGRERHRARGWSGVREDPAIMPAWYHAGKPSLRRPGPPRCGSVGSM